MGKMRIKKVCGEGGKMMDRWRRCENEDDGKVKSLWEWREGNRCMGKAVGLWGRRKDGGSVGKAGMWRRRESGESVRKVGRGRVCGEDGGSVREVVGLWGR